VSRERLFRLLKRRWASREAVQAAEAEVGKKHRGRVEMLHLYLFPAGADPQPWQLMGEYLGVGANRLARAL
jgi:hypothetical protein